MATKKKSIGVIIGAIIGLLAVTAAAIGIATAVRQNTCKHVWNDGEVKVEATCAKEGKLVFKCEECGKYETEAIEKLSHTWEYVEAELPTCTEDGHTEYTACELCGEYKNGVEPQILLAEGHTEIELEGKAPTCTESGLTAGKYCTTCETITVEQRSLKAKGHTLVTLEAKAPTCTEAGLTAGQKCATCDTVYVEQKEVPALGHTDEDEDEVCDVCGEETVYFVLIGEETIDADMLFPGNEAIDKSNIVFKLDTTDDRLKVYLEDGGFILCKKEGIFDEEGNSVSNVEGITMVKTVDSTYYHFAHLFDSVDANGTVYMKAA